MSAVMVYPAAGKSAKTGCQELAPGFPWWQQVGSINNLQSALCRLPRCSKSIGLRFNELEAWNNGFQLFEQQSGSGGRGLVLIVPALAAFSQKASGAGGSSDSAE
jgi:hypothetical protein